MSAETYPFKDSGIFPRLVRKPRASAVTEEDDAPWNEAPAPKLKAAAPPKFDEDEDDESLEFFKKLAG